jgi:hypothetical protein
MPCAVAGETLAYMENGAIRAYSALRVDPDLAHEVAEAYLAGPTNPTGPLLSSYEQLAREADQLFAAITSTARRKPMRVVFTKDEMPYQDAQELIASVRRDRLLEVTVVAAECDRFHPMMDWTPGGAHDRFRAVHDIVGHSYLNLGFDRHAEYATWRFQEQLHSALARQALAVELHAKHSVRWTTGESANHKAVLIDPRLIDRSRIAGGPPETAAGVTPQSPAYLCSNHGSP